ncbi:MAG: Txe/YoeB family addiction module toxin [Puniceicoccales bacterium]|jgi:toxin YoeB|nr:Txe/YoeB family addiction module toxin [Puniceicoccales bacterium]
MKFLKTKRYSADARRLALLGRGAIEKLEKLIEEIDEDPRKGTGNPEQLQSYKPSVVLSRRILGKHRLVYELADDCVMLLSCFGHYNDH